MPKYIALFLLVIAIIVLAVAPYLSIVTYAAQPEASKILDEFSAQALKQDRGVAHNPMFWPMDRWLLEQFTQNKEFRKKLVSACEKLGVAIPETADQDSGRKVDQRPKIQVTTELDRELEKYRAHLEGSHNGAIGQILPELYLRMEGLSALRRYQYADAIGLTEEQQSRISGIVQKAIDQARHFHKSIFATGPNMEKQLEEMRQKLRLISYDLDRKILETLTDEQKLRLSELVQRTEKTDKSLVGPGAF